MRETKIDRTVGTARDLRRRQTPAEEALWQQLRRNQVGVAFRRQYPIGPFIVDFCCIRLPVIVELDGSIHDEDDVREQDKWRSDYPAQRGFSVLRFRNEQFQHQLVDVIDAIRSSLATQGPDEPTSTKIDK